jgi:hypothetical protein
MDKAVTELLDKQAITEGLYRYCRALDRMDKEMVSRVFHDDMTADYDPSQTIRSLKEFIPWMWGHHTRFHNHNHQVSNILIEVNGDTAGSESYVEARLQRRLPNGNFELFTVVGRYVDRWEKRSGQWKIIHRRYLGDMMDQREIEDRLPAGTSFAVRDENDAARDPSYTAIDTHMRRKAAE